MRCLILNSVDPRLEVTEAVKLACVIAASGNLVECILHERTPLVDASSDVTREEPGLFKGYDGLSEETNNPLALFASGEAGKRRFSGSWKPNTVVYSRPYGKSENVFFDCWGQTFDGWDLPYS